MLRHALVCILFCGTSAAYGSETDCASLAARTHDLNLSSGVYTERAQVSAPLKVKIPAGTDATLNAECLRQQGIDPARNFLRAVSRDAECRRAARSTQLVKTEGATPRLASTADDAVYERCAPYDIEVEVLMPSAALN